MDFSRLYSENFSKIYNYVRYHVRLAAEADDVTGRIFEAALHRFETFDPERAPAAVWLFGIARNAVIDWARTRDKRAETSLDGAAEKADPSPRIETALEGKERAELLLAAVVGLDERSRDIIALKFTSGLHNREIARMTGLGESNVGIIIYRAVKKLQSELKGKI